MKDKKHVKSFNEGFFSKKEKDEKLDKINDKIFKGAYSLGSFGTMSKQGAFMNGVRWAINNLSEDEMEYYRKKTDKDDFNFLGF